MLIFVIFIVGEYFFDSRFDIIYCLEKKLDSISSKLDAISSKLDAISSILDAISSKLDTISSISLYI